MEAEVDSIDLTDTEPQIYVINLKMLNQLQLQLLLQLIIKFTLAFYQMATLYTVSADAENDNLPELKMIDAKQHSYNSDF